LTQIIHEPSRQAGQTEVETDRQTDGQRERDRTTA